MKLIVHAGPPKTGSSSLQISMANDQEKLAESGIHYFKPEGKGPHEWALMYLYGASNADGVLPRHLKKFFSSAEQARAWSEANWKKFEAYSSDRSRTCVVISSEHFSSIQSRDAFVGRLRQSYDEVKFVYYARDPVASYVSVIDQSIRGGMRFNELRNLDKLGYHIKAAQKMSAVVGRENIIIRNFDRANLTGGDVKSDFYSLLSQEAGALVEPGESEMNLNESLSGAASAWLLLLNPAFDFSGQGAMVQKSIHKRRRGLIKMLREAPELQGLPRLKLTDTVVKNAIYRKAHNTSRWINDHFMEGQIPIHLGDPEVKVPNKVEIRRRVKTWIMSYLTPDAMQLIGDIFLEQKSAWEKPEK